MLKMALYIIVSVLFGFVIGKMFAKAKSAELYKDKDQKYNNIISEKNATIIKLKNDLRTTCRKVDAINQGYDLQLKLLQKKEEEHKTKQSESFKSISDKDDIISFLEKRISELANTEKNYTH